MRWAVGAVTVTGIRSGTALLSPELLVPQIATKAGGRGPEVPGVSGHNTDTRGSIPASRALRVVMPDVGTTWARGTTRTHL